MDWKFSTVLSLTILAIIAACGQQGAPSANKPVTSLTETRPLAKVAPAFHLAPGVLPIREGP